MCLTFEFTPHDSRHLRVTEWMTHINKQCIGNEPRKQLLRRGMQRWMGWRSEQTITCYDHSFTEREAEEAFAAFQREVECSAIDHDTRASSSPLQQEKDIQPAQDMAMQQVSRELAFWEDMPS